MLIRKNIRFVAGLLSVLILCTLLPAPAFAADVGEGPIIFYEVYGGGGNTGAPYNRDYIVLKNTTDKDVDISGWTLWRATATGNFSDMNNDLNKMYIVLAEGTVVPAGGYCLMVFKVPNASTAGAALPTPAEDVLVLDYYANPIYDLFTLNAQEGKLALTSDSTMPSAENLVTLTALEDYVAYAGTATPFWGMGAAPRLNNEKSLQRNGKYLEDGYSANNEVDYIAAKPDLTYLTLDRIPPVITLPNPIVPFIIDDDYLFRVTITDNIAVASATLTYFNGVTGEKTVPLTNIPGTNIWTATIPKAEIATAIAIPCSITALDTAVDIEGNPAPNSTTASFTIPRETVIVSGGNIAPPAWIETSPAVALTPVPMGVEDIDDGTMPPQTGDESFIGIVALAIGMLSCTMFLLVNRRKEKR